MQTQILSLVVFVVLPCLGGCSFSGIGGGIDTTHLLTPGTTRSVIEDIFGAPVSESPSDRVVEVFSYNQNSYSWSEVEAQTVATYAYKGRVYDDETNADLHMMVGISGGLRYFEALSIARERSKYAQESIHRFQVWYAPDATYLTHTLLFPIHDTNNTPKLRNAPFKLIQSEVP